MTTDHTSQLDQIYREIITDLGGNLTAAQEDYINKLLDTLALMVSEINIGKLSYTLRLRLNDQTLLPRPKDADV